MSTSSPVQIAGYTTVYSQTPKLVSNSWSQLSAGDSFMVGIKSNGLLYAWGTNTVGQLGITDVVTRSSPTQIGSFTWSTVDASNNYVLALRSDNLLFSWGSNTLGQLGQSDTLNRSSPVQIGSSSWAALAAGNSHAVGIRSDKTLWAWGNNTVGQLGQGYSSVFIPNVSSPLQIGTSSYTIVSAGNNYTLAIDITNKLYSWGDNTYGQLAYGAYTPTIFSWTGVSSSSHTAAIRSDGLLFTWGTNVYGRLGDNTTISKSSPTQIGTSSWLVVSAGSDHSVAIRLDGRLFSWGNNSSGVLGLNLLSTGITGRRSSPTQIDTTSSFVNIIAGNNTDLAIKNDATLWSWGSAPGLGDTVARSSPVQIAGSWTKIAASITVQYAIKTDGSLWAWGNSNYGGLGQGDTISRSSPTQIGTSSWTSVFASPNAYNVYAINTNNKLFGWGAADGGTAGSIGDGLATLVMRSSPVQISSGNWSSVALGNPMVGIKTDGSLWMWGTSAASTSNYYLGVTSSRTYSWVQISTNNNTTGALRSDGRLFMWGNNTSGQLGFGDTITRSSPTQIGLDGGVGGYWNSIAVGQSHTLAIRCDNTIWAWGGNNAGQLGKGNISASILSPIQVGTSSWSQVSAGNLHSAAISTTGALYIWGDNTFGQIGNNITSTSSILAIFSGDGATGAISANGTLWFWGGNNISRMFPSVDVYLGTLGNNRSSPTQVSSSTKYITGNFDIGGGFLIGSNGALYGTGVNSSGQLGLGNTISRSSPTQIGTATNWATVSTANSTTLAINTLSELWGWGVNDRGQLGINDTISRSAPIQISGSWLAVTTAGTGWTLGIKTDNTLWSWGASYNGVLGFGGGAATLNRSSPSQIGTSSWSFIPPKLADTAFAIRIDGTLWSWGGTEAGTLGLLIAGTLGRSSPTQIGSASGWTSLCSSGTASSSNDHVLGINNGIVYAWGYNLYGQLGLADRISRSSPVQVLGASDATAVFAGIGWVGLGNSGYISSTNLLYTWGNNDYGQLGQNNRINRSSPTQLGNITSLGSYVVSPTQIGSSSWSTISAGTNFSLGLYNNSTLMGWGINNTAQVSTSFSKLTQMCQVRNAVLNLTAAGKIFAWGWNAYGEFGNNSTATVIPANFVSERSAVQVGTDTGWKMISSSGHAIKKDNTLWVIGGSGVGHLGLNNTISYSSPMQIGTASDWTFISGSINNAGGIRSDGTLWVWGTAALGTGDTIWRSSPTQIGGSWSSVGFDRTGNNSYGIKTDYTLWTWGSGFYGTLGDGTTINKSSPVQVPGSWIMATFSAEGDVMHGIQISSGLPSTIGTLWAWGTNQYGQLGLTLPTTIYRSSPTQVGVNSSWSLVAGTSGYITYGVIGNTLYNWGADYYGLLNAETRVTGYWPASSSYTIFSSPVQIGTGFNSNAILYTGDLQAGTPTTIIVDSVNTQYQIGIVMDGTVTNPKRNSILTQIGVGYPMLSSPTQISTNSYSLISAGGSHALAVTTQGYLYGWGANDYGQAGYAQLDNAPILTAGYLASGFISSITGALYLWGYNAIGTLGTGDTLYRSSPVQIAAATSWIQISNSKTGTAGQNFTLGIRSDNRLFAWGMNTQGQLGIGDTITRSSPSQIGTSSWTSVSAGGSHSLAIRSDGSIWSWGYNDQGQLGYSKLWTAINTNYNCAFGLKADGSLWSWGANYNGVLGLATDTLARSSPTQIGTNKTWLSLVQGASNAGAAIRNDNTLWMWGTNTNGELGLGDTIARSSPTQLPGSWSQIFGGNVCMAGTKIDGTLWLWGNNSTGQLGDGTVISKSSPVQILGGGSWTQLRAGGLSTADHALAIKSNGTLWAWGYNIYGQVGDGTTVNKSSPIQIGTSSWTAIGAGSGHSLAIDTLTRKVWTWGNAGTGQLGNSLPPGTGGTNGRSAPMQITTLTGSYTVVAGGDILTSEGYSFALATDGTLYAWGFNSKGQLGNSATINRSAPVQIAGSFTTINGGSVQASAIAIDASVYVWGQNSAGELGQGDTITRSSPVQVSGILINSPNQIGTSSWTAISAGGAFSIAVAPDNTLWTWGLNSSGQLGLATDTISRSSPIQIGTSSWSVIAAGDAHTLGIDIVSNLYAWGLNSSGQLGQVTDTVARSSPVQVAAGTQYNIVSAGTSHSGAIRLNDSSLWMWGLNTSGQLGDATIVSKSSPTQINTGVTSVTLYSISNTTGYLYNTNTTYAMGTSDFTIEAYIYRSSTGVRHTIVSRKNSLSTTYYYWELFIGTTDKLALGRGITNADGTGTEYIFTGSTSIPANTWVHIAVTGVASTYTMQFFINGILDYTSNSSTYWVTCFGSTGPLTIGISVTLTRPFIGKISNLRWLIGTCLYTTNFYIPTTPLIALTNTVFLGCNSSSSISDGVGFRNFTKNGDWATYSTDNPFTYYGVRFISSGLQYISVTDSASQRIGTNSFTIEAWIYLNTVGVYHAIYTKGSTSPATGIYFYVNSNNLLELQSADTPVITSINTINVSQWTHVAISRDGSNNLRLFINGIKESTVTNSTDFSQTDNARIGLSRDSAQHFNGTITDFRLVIGTAVYIGSSFAVPTGPLQVITNTALLTCNSSTYIDESTNNATITNNSSSIASGITIFSSNSNVSTSIWNNIALGVDHTVALASNNLYAWGSNSAGQLGAGTVSNKSTPTLITTLFNAPVIVSSPVQLGTNSWIAISAGNNSSLGSTNAYTLYGWGNNIAGQLGDSTTISRSSPVQISTTYSFTSLSTGLSNTYGISATNNLMYAWGAGEAGQIGNALTISRSNPIQIATASMATNSQNYPMLLTSIRGSSWTQVATGVDGISALSSDNLLYIWGYNGYGQMGNYTLDSVSSPLVLGNAIIPFNASPTQIGTSSWSQVSAGYKHALALDTNNLLYGWGSLAGNNPIPSSARWSTVVAGASHMMGIKVDGTLWAWGDNTYGSLGDGTTVDKSSPIQIGTSSYISVSAGLNFTMAIAIDNTLWMWGLNSSGQLGLSDRINRSSPMQIESSSWTSVSAGGSHSLAIRSDGSIWSWGQAMGQGDTINRSSPTQIGTSSWISVSAGNNSAAGITSDGVIYYWGVNFLTGVNTMTPTLLYDSTSVFYPDNSKVLVIDGTYVPTASSSIGGQVLFILTKYGELRAIGTATPLMGNQGSPTVIMTAEHSRNNPYNIQGNNQYWLDIKGGIAASAVQAKRSDGTIWAWGVNAGDGKLGVNDNSDRSEPVLISGFTNGTLGAVSRFIGAYIDAMGQLYTCGSRNITLGSFGTFGYPSQGNMSSPTQIATSSLSSPVQINSTSYNSISAGYESSTIVDFTKTLYFWGQNNNYQSGLVNKTPATLITSPVAIGTLATSTSDGTTNASYIKNA